MFPFDLDGIEDEEERALANELKERVMQYYAKMFEISKVCLAAIAHSLGEYSFFLYCMSQLAR